MAGGAGGIGQPLSLLLKNSPLVTELAVYDVAHAPGVAADLSHIPTPGLEGGGVFFVWFGTKSHSLTEHLRPAAKVTGHVGDDQLGAALKVCVCLGWEWGGLRHLKPVPRTPILPAHRHVRGPSWSLCLRACRASPE